VREPDFYLSADMRLIELQRSALGLQSPERPDWENRAVADGPTVAAETVEAPSGAVVNVMASAIPSEGVIPGAIVTVTLVVANEGVAPARDVRVTVPLPGGASYRLGSFVRDGSPAYDELAERFFGAGLDLGDIAPKSRATFLWKIGIRIGTRPLVVAPHIRLSGGAAIGGKSVAIHRNQGAIVPPAAAPERPAATPVIPTAIPVPDLPFYELDEREAADAAAAMPPPVAAELPPPPMPEPVATAVEIEPEPEPAPRAREAIALLGTFDRPTLSFFERSLRGSNAPTILQHCIFGSALACTRSYATGGDEAGLREHFDAQSQILHRIALHEKLGRKEPVGEYAGTLRARIGDLLTVPLGEPAIASDATQVVLETDLSEPTMGVLHSLEAESGRWDFVKARQLTLALQAQRVVGTIGDEASRANVENALRAYAQASVTTLQKLFVRIRIDRTTGVLSQTDPELDRKAHAVLDALAALF